MSIGAVERETGLSKDTLRIWEKRYGFPQPVRDAAGERAYPIEQVEKLRLLKRLLDGGHRPGKIVAREPAELQALAGAATGPERGALDAQHQDLDAYIDLCREYRFDELRRLLSQQAMKLGLARFVIELVGPLTTLVGNCWASGRLAVFEEHLYTESVQIVLRAAIAAIPSQHADASPRPRVLLTTLPDEAHGLGLLMAEAILAIEGARCISLGVQTPVMEIVRAAESQRADIVALSVSAAMRGAVLREAMHDLRAQLPDRMEIWAGGACPALRRRPPPGLRVLDLPHIGEVLEEWRRHHTGTAVA